MLNESDIVWWLIGGIVTKIFLIIKTMEQKKLQSVIVVELNDDLQGPVDGLFLTVESMLEYFKKYYGVDSDRKKLEFSHRSLDWQDDETWPVLDQIRYYLDNGGFGYWKARVIRYGKFGEDETTFAVSVRHLH